MIKSKVDKQVEKLEIDLTGPKGNAFYLIGTAKKLAKALDIEWEPILEEMKNSDYENVLKVFDREFGDYVILWR